MANQPTVIYVGTRRGPQEANRALMAATSTSLLRFSPAARFSLAPRFSLALSTSATGRYLPWARRPI